MHEFLMSKEGKKSSYRILVGKEIDETRVVELTGWAGTQLSSQHSAMDGGGSLAGHWAAPLMEQRLEYLRGICLVLNPFPRVK